MNTGMFVIHQGDQLVEMKQESYDSEALLQDLLARYPSLLAGDQINSISPRRWLLVSREAAIPSEQDGAGRWAVDHLFLDQDAIPTLVEVKRSQDTRIRREVIGQMLDYAANAVVYWPVESIQAAFEAICRSQNCEPEQMLSDFLAGDMGSNDFWQKTKTNLQAGRIRMLFVADEIPTELQRVVEFLNAQMDPAEVLAFEVKQYVGQGLKTLVPRVMGQTAEAQSKKSAVSNAARQWDEASFFNELISKRNRLEAKIAHRILKWSESNVSWIWWGQGRTFGSFVPMIGPKGRGRTFIAVWTYGTVEIHFQYLQSTPPFNTQAKREELQQRLNAIPGIEIPPDAISRRPSIPLAIIAEETSLNQFLGALHWLVNEVNTAKKGGMVNG